MKNKIIPITICVIALIIGIGILQWRSVGADERMVSDIDTQASENKTIAEEVAEITEAVAQSNIDIQPRVENDAFVIGSPDAPVTIMEFSSLSCPHCATFHKNTLPDLKKDYVQTGKVKFVFNDFPLNAPAVAASLLLKCVPADNRYDFMEMLFEQQEQWAFDANFINKLKQYASLLGIGNNTAEECMANTTEEAKMFDIMRAQNETHAISSTPSFIIMPGDEKLTGAQPYGEFSKRIEELLKEE